MDLPIDDRAQIAAAMKDVRDRGNSVAHHLRGDIYEVRARTATRQLRILYATEGRSDHILLALHTIVKSTRAVPDRDIALAERRLQIGDRADAPLDDMPYMAYRLRHSQFSISQ